MTVIGTRKSRYPGNDPENGPACLHEWTGVRWEEVPKTFTVRQKIAAYLSGFYDGVRHDYWQHVEMGWIDQGENPNLVHVTFTGHVLLALGAEVVFWSRVAYCHFFGHDWEDESYGGPDSGCMAASCRRCGFGYHHTLY